MHYTIEPQTPRPSLWAKYAYTVDIIAHLIIIGFTLFLAGGEIYALWNAIALPVLLIIHVIVFLIAAAISYFGQYKLTITDFIGAIVIGIIVSIFTFIIPPLILIWFYNKYISYNR